MTDIQLQADHSVQSKVVYVTDTASVNGYCGPAAALRAVIDLGGGQAAESGEPIALLHAEIRSASRYFESYR